MKNRCVSYLSSARVRASPETRTPRPPAWEYGSVPSNDTRENRESRIGSESDRERRTTIGGGQTGGLNAAITAPSQSLEPRRHLQHSGSRHVRRRSYPASR